MRLATQNSVEPLDRGIELETARCEVIPDAGFGRTRPPELTLKRILVPVDFSECSRRALKYAGALASRLNAQITLLHVVKTTYPGSHAETVLRLLAEMHRRAENQLGRWAKSELPNPARVETVESCSVPETISQAAKRLASDLIVIGTHRYRGLKRLFKGGTTEKVVRQSPCPVLRVPERASEHFG